MKNPKNAKELVNTRAKELVNTRAKLQYIAGCSRPEISAQVQLMPKEVVSPSESTFKEMNAVIEYLEITKDYGLKVFQLDPNSLSLQLSTDGAFANYERK